MPAYFISPRAARDLRDIQEFIADRSPAAAGRLMTRLTANFRSLAANPFLGRERPDLAPDLRSFPVTGYLIYYYPTDTGVTIARIAHGSMEARRLFNP